MKTPNYYAGLALDRGSMRRRDPAQIAALLADPATRLLPVWRSRSLILEGAEPSAALLSAAAVVAIEGLRIYLGHDEEGAYFALNISQVEEGEATGIVGGIASSAKFIDLRSVGPTLARRDGALLAYARGLSYWHDRHRFCGVCGAPSEVQSGGHVRVCTNETCKAEHFPRTDPAVIMLVHHGDRCLLARSKRFPAIPMHSTLAGFVEPGESLEDAVAREVKEEVGVDVVDVQYHSSQPWPFPGSIMLGFHARALNTEITLDDDEITSAGWFDRAFLRAPQDPDKFRMPRADSIARRLIEDWIAGG
jgi:NAD+ diphosphatase